MGKYLYLDAEDILENISQPFILFSPNTLSPASLSAHKSYLIITPKREHTLQR